MDLDFFENPDVKKAMEQGLEIYKIHAAETGMDQHPLLQRVLDGETIAQAQGLTRDDLEVLYELGFNMLTSGEIQKAEDVFVQLCVIDPLEAKNHYLLGVVRQQKADWAQATEDFSRFLAMDATNPEGYLRIAECYVARGQKEEARDVVEVALAEARKGHGPDDAIAQAERALEALTA